MEENRLKELARWFNIIRRGNKKTNFKARKKLSYE